MTATPKLDSARLGERIRAARQAARLTQQQLARAVGFRHQSTVSNWETGAQQPSLTALLSAARVLGVTVEDLTA